MAFTFREATPADIPALAERLFSDAGEFHGGYGWRDSRQLAQVYPIE